MKPNPTVWDSVSPSAKYCWRLWWWNACTAMNDQCHAAVNYLIDLLSVLERVTWRPVVNSKLEGEMGGKPFIEMAFYKARNFRVKSWTKKHLALPALKANQASEVFYLHLYLTTAGFKVSRAVWKASLETPVMIYHWSTSTNKPSEWEQDSLHQSTQTAQSFTHAWASRKLDAPQARLRWTAVWESKFPSLPTNFPYAQSQFKYTIGQTFPCLSPPHFMMCAFHIPHI